MSKSQHKQETDMVVKVGDYVKWNSYMKTLVAGKTLRVSRVDGDLFYHEETGNSSFYMGGGLYTVVSDPNASPERSKDSVKVGDMVVSWVTKHDVFAGDSYKVLGVCSGGIYVEDSAGDTYDLSTDEWDFPPQSATGPSPEAEPVAELTDEPSILSMSLREYAAIKLRVPRSGTPWLDEMIQQSRRDWFTGMVVLGYTDVHEESVNIAACCTSDADAMIAALDNGGAE